VEYLTADDLTTSHLPEDDVPLPGLGLVRVRGLSRQEVLDMPDVVEGDEGSSRRQQSYILTRGMLIPSMTEDQVDGWMGAGISPEVNDVLKRLGELSGLTSTAVKDTTRELMTDDGAQFRDVPSGTAGDDPGAPAEDAGG
jgi:hypothetical protein